MAVKMKKTSNSGSNESEVKAEATVSRDITTEAEEVFTMLCGYRDEEGELHTTFTLREMNGKDEEALNKAEFRQNSAKAITCLLTRCLTSIGSLTPKGVGGRENWEKIIRNLYTGDQDYILMQLRKISIGESISFKSTCSYCGAELNSEVLIDELEVIEYKGQETIPFELPKGYRDPNGELHTTGTLRFPIGIDRELLIPVAKQNPAKGKTLLLSRLCKFDDGLFVTSDVMSSLTTRDRAYLDELLNENIFGIKTSLNIECPECGVEAEVSFETANFM